MPGPYAVQEAEPTIVTYGDGRKLLRTEDEPTVGDLDPLHVTKWGKYSRLCDGQKNIFSSPLPAALETCVRIGARNVICCDWLLPSYEKDCDISTKPEVVQSDALQQFANLAADPSIPVVGVPGLEVDVSNLDRDCNAKIEPPAKLTKAQKRKLENAPKAIKDDPSAASASNAAASSSSASASSSASSEDVKKKFAV